MRMVDLIDKKKQGYSLRPVEIKWMVDGYNNGVIPDYQMSAWAMAVCWQGMTHEETVALTEAMVDSGKRMDLSTIEGCKVDKHSTGGVGDKTTLVLAPLVAACGVPVAKMSGRGLGHTGGTIDKLEAFTGFNATLSPSTFVKLVNQHKLALSAQSNQFAPADKKLYALRDVTATVNSIPLIASSIMSKKIAAGCDAIVLDVKTGSGAFMPTIEGASQLAQMMVDIGEGVGIRTTAVISNMEQPLGYAVGNAIEVKEAIDTLSGNGAQDLVDLCMELGSRMLVIAGKVSKIRESKQQLQQVIANGSALKKMRDWIVNQGGDGKQIDNPDQLPRSTYTYEVVAATSGYVCAIEARKIGEAAMKLGAGRATVTDQIDYGAGVVLQAKIGDQVTKGQPIASLYSNHSNPDDVMTMIKDAFTIQENPLPPPRMILNTI